MVQYYLIVTIKAFKKRGVRQGDPLSPYLFILAADFLSRWTSRLQVSRALTVPFHGIKACTMYADDLLFIIRPNIQNFQVIKVMLAFWEIISGLKINMTKSEVVTVATDPVLTQRLAALLNCQQGSFPLKYLGLPLRDKNLMKEDYMQMIEKIQARLRGWEAALLSPAGRLVLINSVLSAIPVYFMSVVKLPVWVIKLIDKMRCRFLWHGPHIDNNKIHLVKWEKVCQPKSRGGLGVMDLIAFNEAMLAKWMWKWASQSSSLWVDLNRAMNVGLRPWEEESTIPFWKMLRSTFSSFENRLKAQVHSGQAVCFWHHDWGHGILKVQLKELHSFMVSDNCTVRDAVAHKFQDDDLYKSTNLSIEAREQLHYAQVLLALLGDLNNQHDDIIWTIEASGKFSVRSCYQFIKGSPQPESTLRHIWSLLIPPRIQFFVWLLLQDKILTVANLKKRGWALPEYCFLCNQGGDSVLHLFTECVFSRSFLQKVIDKYNLWIPTFSAMNISTTDIIEDEGQNKTIRGLLAISCFILWRERCNRIFREQVKTQDTLLQEVEDEWRICQRRNSV